MTVIRWWVWRARQWVRRVRRCDACNRVRPTRYSPPHGANFCRTHYEENNR